MVMRCCRHRVRQVEADKRKKVFFNLKLHRINFKCILSFRECCVGFVIALCLLVGNRAVLNYSILLSFA
jgi:hypothetical protein